MRVIITGAAGLIGSRFAQWIVNHVPSADVFGVDDLSGGWLENAPPDMPMSPYTLGSTPTRFVTLCRGLRPDYVFHFAAFAAEVLSPFVRQHTVRNTWLATADVLNGCIACGSVRRLVFTSSIAVYGRQPSPFDEAMQPTPIDPYGVGKAACEADIRIAGEQHGLPWTIIRPHNVYGAQQNIWGDYRNVLGIWMRQALQGEPLRVHGDGSQARAFSCIDDCLPCLWEAATSAGAADQTINLGGTRPITILEAAQLVAQITGAPGIQHTDARHEVHQAWATWQRSVDLLGYSDSTPLENGIAAMWAWAQDAWYRFPHRRQAAPLQYEVDEGLYPWWRNGSVTGRPAVA